MSRSINELQEDIRTLTRICGFAINDKLNEIAEEVGEVYQQGREDRELELIKVVKAETQKARADERAKVVDEFVAEFKKRTSMENDLIDKIAKKIGEKHEESFS